MESFTAEQLHQPVPTNSMEFDLACSDRLQLPYPSPPSWESSLTGFHCSHVNTCSQLGQSFEPALHMGVSHCLQNDSITNAFFHPNSGQILGPSGCGAAAPLGPYSRLDPSFTLDLGRYWNFDLWDFGPFWNTDARVAGGLGPSGDYTLTDTLYQTTCQPVTPNHWVGLSPMTLEPEEDTSSVRPTQSSNPSHNPQQGSSSLENKDDSECSDMRSSNDQHISEDRIDQDLQFRSSSPMSYLTLDMTRYRCGFPNCKKTFKRKEHAKRHYLTIHDWRKRLICEFCGKDTFRRTDNLNAHRRLHARRGFTPRNGNYSVLGAGNRAEGD